MPKLPRKKGESKTSQSVRTAVHEQKRGQLRSGSKSGPPVKSRKQAIAIGLSEARKAGAKVPDKPKPKVTRKGQAAKKKVQAKKTPQGSKRPRNRGRG